MSEHGHSPGGEAVAPATFLGRAAIGIEKAVRPVYKWLAYAGAVVIGAVVIAMVYSSIGRYVKHPLAGSDDIMKMGYLLMMTLAIGFEHLGHEKMTVDAVIKLFPKKFQAWMAPIIFVLVLAVLAFAVVYTVKYGVSLMGGPGVLPERTVGVMHLLRYPFVFIIAFGVFTLIPIYVARLFESIDRLVKR